MKFEATSIDATGLGVDSGSAGNSVDRERFLALLDAAVRPLIDPAEITATGARLLGEHLGADRCAYADVEADEDTFNLTGDYNRPGVISIVGRYRFADFGRHVLELMRADEPYVADDVDAYRPSLGDLTAYRATQIRAVVCVPLHKSGRFVAAMAVHQREPRRWATDDVRLVQQVAARCWESIERARVERTLRHSEARFRAAFEQAMVGMVIADTKGVVRRANAAFCDLVGRPLDELVGRDSRGYTYVDDRQPNADQIGRIESARSGSARYEKRYVRPDGQVVWAHIHLSPVHDAAASDEGVMLLAVVEDITQRKQAERELSRVSEQRRLALDSARLGWWHVDPAGGQVIWDERFKEIFGVEVDRLPYASVIDAIHPDDRASVEAGVLAATRPGAQQPYDIQYRIVRPSDGVVRWVEAHGKAFFDGEVAGRRFTSFAGTVADVTAERAAADALAEEKNVLERIASGATMGEVLDLITRSIERQSTDGMLCSIFLLDETGTRLKLGAAPSIPEPYRRSIDGAMIGPGNGPCGIAAHERKVICVTGTDDADDGRWADWHRFARPYGLASCCATPIFSADHERVIGTVAMYYPTARAPGEHDAELTRAATHLAGIVIERDAAEHRLRQSLAAAKAARAEAERASRMKDEFLATLSHELRTPLNAIVGWSQILRTTPNPTAEDLEEGLSTIDRNARAQTQIIEDLLDMSRIISGKVRLDVRPIDLPAVVRASIDTVRHAADTRGVRLNVVIDDGAGTVSGDPARLQQVLWNLLSNAIKFTPRGGQVRVVLERVNSHVEVNVVDTGEGIKPDFLPFVFDRFRQADSSSTRRHGGLGLGLSIVKQLMDLHGGSVRAKSDGPGRGSTFTLTLPLRIVHAGHGADVDREHARAGGSPADGDADACPHINGLRVLVVDDEPDGRTVVRKLLEECGVVVTTAGSVPEAKVAFARERPDVLVSDIGMPDEDGYALIRWVRSLPPHEGRDTPALALTAYARTVDRMKAMKAGYQTHAAKPVEPAELVLIVGVLSGRVAR